MTKKCSKCKLIKPKTEFRKNINSKDGFQSYCKRCANKYSNEWASKEENKIKRKIQSQNKRAEKEGLKHDLTIEQWNRILTDFNGQCSLTNSTERVCLEHFVPLSIKAGGTTIGNVYPITENLNMSKYLILNIAFIIPSASICSMLTNILANFLPSFFAIGIGCIVSVVFFVLLIGSFYLIKYL